MIPGEAWFMNCTAYISTLEVHVIGDECIINTCLLEAMLQIDAHHIICVALALQMHSSL
jgi:hypothetical protein